MSTSLQRLSYTFAIIVLCFMLLSPKAFAQVVSGTLGPGQSAGWVDLLVQDMGDFTGSGCVSSVHASQSFRLYNAATNAALTNAQVNGMEWELIRYSDSGGVVERVRVTNSATSPQICYNPINESVWMRFISDNPNWHGVDAVGMTGLAYTGHRGRHIQGRVYLHNKSTQITTRLISPSGTIRSRNPQFSVQLNETFNGTTPGQRSWFFLRRQDGVRILADNSADTAGAGQRNRTFGLSLADGFYYWQYSNTRGNANTVRTGWSPLVNGGNIESSAAGIMPFYVDRTEPAIISHSVTPGVEPQVQVSARDQQSGLDFVRVTLTRSDGTTVQSTSNFSSSNTRYRGVDFSFGPTGRRDLTMNFTNLQSGTYTYTVRARDNALNITDESGGSFTVPTLSNSLTGSGCVITTAGASTCSGTISWQFTNNGTIVSPTHVRRDPGTLLYGNVRSGTNQPITLNLGNNSIRLVHNNNTTVVASRTLSATCGSGLVSDGTRCVAVTANELSGTTCTITTANASTCVGRVTWNFTNNGTIANNTNVRRNPSTLLYTNTRTGTNQNITLNLGSNTIRLVHTNNTLVVGPSLTLDVVCASPLEPDLVNGICVAPATPPPDIDSLILTQSSCEILVENGANCTIEGINWNIVSDVSPNIFNATRNLLCFNGQSGSNGSCVLRLGANTIQARNGSTVRASAVATAVCGGDLEPNAAGTSCVSPTPPPTPPPSDPELTPANIVITPGQNFVRSGVVTHLDITVTATYPVDCSIAGSVAQNSFSIDPTSYGGTATQTIPTNVLRFASNFTVTCTGSGGTSSATSRINVAPTVFEI